MKNFVITYRPFAQSTVTASDIVIPAEDADKARTSFESHCPQYYFVSAKEQ